MFNSPPKIVNGAIISISKNTDYQKLWVNNGEVVKGSLIMGASGLRFE
jgi:hypothetical protein